MFYQVAQSAHHFLSHWRRFHQTLMPPASCPIVRDCSLQHRHTRRLSCTHFLLGFFCMTFASFTFLGGYFSAGSASSWLRLRKKAWERPALMVKTEGSQPFYLQHPCRKHLGIQEGGDVAVMCIQCEDLIRPGEWDFILGRILSLFFLPTGD